MVLSLLRSARLPVRQRLICEKGLISLLNLPDVVGKAFWNVQSVCGFVSRGFVREVGRRANSSVKVTKEDLCDVVVCSPGFEMIGSIPVAMTCGGMIESRRRRISGTELMSAEFPRDRFGGLTGRRSGPLGVVLSPRCLVNVLSPGLTYCPDSKLLLESG